MLELTRADLGLAGGSGGGGLTTSSQEAIASEGAALETAAPGDGSLYEVVHLPPRCAVYGARRAVRGARNEKSKTDGCF